MTEPTSQLQPRAPRLYALDAARALAVLAMVYGHTMDAVLSAESRQVPWVQTYWTARAFTAPLFLFVSGWTLFWVLSRNQSSPGSAWRRMLPRVALLLAIGYLLRFPFWDLRGLASLDHATWWSLLRFDALQCIAVSMVAGLAVWSAVRSERLRVLVFGGLALAVLAATGWVWRSFGEPSSPAVLSQSLGGGDALFPLFPWTAYFLLGATFGVWFVRLPTRWHAVALLGGLGGLVLAATLLAAAGQPSTLSNTDVVKILWRVGPVFLISATALLMPERLARAIGPIGRASLWAYVIHLPIAYGWAYWPGLASRVGPTLSDVEACLVAVGVVAFSATAAVLGQRVYSRIRWRELALKGVAMVAGSKRLPRRSPSTRPEASREALLPD